MASHPYLLVVCHCFGVFGEAVRSGSDDGEAGPMMGEAGPMMGEAGPIMGEAGPMMDSSSFFRRFGRKKEEENTLT